MYEPIATSGREGVCSPLQSAEAPLLILTPRQREIARLLCNSGFSYKEIADRLGISGGTMRKHAENVYRRLRVHSRAELTVLLR